MISRKWTAVAVTLLFSASYGIPAWANNQMGYRLLSQQDAANLPHRDGALGLDVERVQQMTDGGMTFDIIGVKHVRPGSAGERAGLKPGDEIVALDGQVFPSLAAFADYIRSSEPGSQMTVDFMPAGGGPQQAQRAAIIVGRAGQTAPPKQPYAAPARTGMSTGEKIAIGAGAVALLGCYEAGCFSHHPHPADARQQGPAANGFQQQGQAPSRYQQQGQAVTGYQPPGQPANGYQPR